MWLDRSAHDHHHLRSLVFGSPVRTIQSSLLAAFGKTKTKTCGSGPLWCMAVTSLNFLPTFLQYFNLYIYCKNVGKIFRLVTAMHRNGPLPQVVTTSGTYKQAMTKTDPNDRTLWVFLFFFWSMFFYYLFIAKPDIEFCHTWFCGKTRCRLRHSPVWPQHSMSPFQQ